MLRHFNVRGYRYNPRSKDRACLEKVLSGKIKAAKDGLGLGSHMKSKTLCGFHGLENRAPDRPETAEIRKNNYCFQVSFQLIRQTFVNNYNKFKKDVQYFI